MPPPLLSLPLPQVEEAQKAAEAAATEAAAARERAQAAEREAAGALVRLAESQRREVEVGALPLGRCHLCCPPGPCAAALPRRARP